MGAVVRAASAQQTRATSRGRTITDHHHYILEGHWAGPVPLKDFQPGEPCSKMQSP